jgi:hypothetical protein
MEKRSIPSNIQPPRPIACNSSTPEVRGPKLGLRSIRIAEACGVWTYFADDLAGSGLTLRARRGHCWRRIDDVGHREVGRFSGIRLAVAGADA